ncbi:11806_t:CDS:2, partial [Dentiscutata heterogama]
MGIGITPTPLSKLPPGGKIICPKSEKAKALQEIMDYAKLGLDIEDERLYDLMKIDLAILNIARRIGENPTMNIVNTSRTVRKKKPPVIKRVIKKVVRPKNKRVNLDTYEEATKDPNNEKEEVYEEIIYENEDNENVDYESCKKKVAKKPLLAKPAHNNYKKIEQKVKLASSMALDEPMNINLIRRPANDLTTAEYRINIILIPKAVLDGGAQCTMI